MNAAESRDESRITDPVICLLVDDLEDNLVALRALLQRDDVRVLTARSGAEALDMLLSHDVALAILDVQMPEMDGFELAELMRGSERTRHVPLIFVTAGGRDHYRLFKGYDAGAVDFLYKPIEPHILKNKADVFFQLHRQKLRLQRELHERTEMLRLNEMFAAVLGHDLRVPLSAIVTGAQLLQRRSEEGPTRDVAARMLSSGLRMHRMIDDLRDLARARLAGGIPIERAHVDLEPIVRRVVDEVRSGGSGREVEILCEGDGAGHWDGGRLGQAVTNVIGNAVKHGAGGRVQVHLDGRTRDEVCVTVRNAGAIDPGLVPHVFEPFRRGSSDRGATEGLGLGLYIAQQIAWAHGGTVDVQSGPGDVTVQCLRLPRGEAGDSLRQPAQVGDSVDSVE